MTKKTFISYSYKDDRLQNPITDCSKIMRIVNVLLFLGLLYNEHLVCFVFLKMLKYLSKQQQVWQTLELGLIMRLAKL